MNDVFFPGGSGFEVLELAVYSRWGQKVWSGVSGGWDGRLDGTNLPSDVYAYRGRLRFKGVTEERKGRGDATAVKRHPVQDDGYIMDGQRPYII